MGDIPVGYCPVCGWECQSIQTGPFNAVMGHLRREHYPVWEFVKAVKDRAKVEA